MTRQRRILALACGLFAVCALVLGAWSAAQFRAASLGRPWFVAPTALAVAEDGTLFVAANGDEIQVYRADGSPLRAWRLSRSGVRRLHLDGDRLSVLYADGDRVEAFTRDGAPLGEHRDSGAHFAEGGEGVTGDGTAVALRAEGIVRTAPPPAEVLVPLPPPPLSLFGERPLLPVTLVLLSALGALVMGLALLRPPSEAPR